MWGRIRQAYPKCVALVSSSEPTGQASKVDEGRKQPKMLGPNRGQVSLSLSWIDEQTRAEEKLGSMGQGQRRPALQVPNLSPHLLRIPIPCVQLFGCP